MNQRSYWTYLLECADGSFYAGVTNDPISRTRQHNEAPDKNAFTANRRPVVLVWCEEFEDVQDAIAAEKRIKGWSRAKKIALIERDYERLKMLAKKKPATKQLSR